MNSYIEILKELKKEYKERKDPYDIESLSKEGFKNICLQILNDSNYTYVDKCLFISNIYTFKCQKNLMDIINGCILFLEKNIESSNIDEDWIIDFYDKASKISSDDFKTIWSRILAEEINKPTSISKRLLHNLFIMSKKDAESFINLSRFCFYDAKSDEVYPIIFCREHPNAYKKSKITVDILKELERLSLIECDFESGFAFKKETEYVEKHLIYTNHRIGIVSDKIKLGNVRLTSDGRKLFDIIEKHNNNLILDYTVDIWKQYGYNVAVYQR